MSNVAYKNKSVAPTYAFVYVEFVYVELFPDNQVDTSKLQQPTEPKRYFGKFVALKYNLT